MNELGISNYNIINFIMILYLNKNLSLMTFYTKSFFEESVIILRERRVVELNNIIKLIAG